MPANRSTRFTAGLVVALALAACVVPDDRAITRAGFHHAGEPHAGQDRTGSATSAKARSAGADSAGMAALQRFRRSRQGWCKGFLAPDRVGGFAGRVALTFDDGPSSLLPKIVRILRRHRAPATFFMLGRQVRGYRAPAGFDIASLNASSDISIANHTWSHPNLTRASPAFFFRQVDRAHTALKAAGAAPTLFRAPLGVLPCGTQSGLRDRGYTDVGWHIDSADWCYASGGTCNPGEYRLFRWVPRAMRRDMTKFILHQLRATNGGILLFHDIHHFTASRLDAILTAITAAGFTYTSLNDARTFPHLNGDASAPVRRIASMGARCKTSADCDFGLPSYLGFCHPDGYCSMACENRCRGRGMACRADARVSRDYKVCLRR